MGVLTQFLIEKNRFDLSVVELDRESVQYLHSHFPMLRNGKIYGEDFLKMDLKALFKGNTFGIVGNFPYNISSQIFFKVLENKDLVPEVVCMLQKEVAQRIASKPGGRDYGILSVLLQAYYDIDYCFSLGPEVFDPPPKVNSGVIRLKRNDVSELGCDEKLFLKVVKTAFNQRRKTLRNALKSLEMPENELLDLRAERLGVKEYVYLTNLLSQ
jgi:16S rRNA (adenine1518-N6/adenine1519-N6)-dimethyltransferase